LENGWKMVGRWYVTTTLGQSNG